PEPEDSGIGAVLSKILDILLSIFGLGGSEPEPEVNYEEQLEEIEILLTDLLPPRGMMEDDSPEQEEQPEEEDLLEAA
ncbi:MAG: hypothetical protein HKP37_05855, partial [Boseongicola sp.]|nr:hypothetical protein [Boseongicola sp.]